MMIETKRLKPKWKDTFVYAILESDVRSAREGVRNTYE